MAEPVFFGDDPKAYYTVSIGGSELPGVAKVEGLKLGNKYDIKEAPGTDGAVFTFQGYTPAPFDVVVRFWTRAHFVEWVRLFRKMRPKPGKQRPGAVDIVHPQLVAADITRVVIREIEPKFESQAHECKISCTQWLPAPKKKATQTLFNSNDQTFASTQRQQAAPPSTTAGTRGGSR